LRLLGERDRPEVVQLLQQNPVANAFVESRIMNLSGHHWRLGGELWGYVSDGAVQALCFSGANLVPVAADDAALAAFAHQLVRQGRRCSSIVGPAEQVLPLWHYLEPDWGPAREVRPDQPLLAISSDSVLTPDSLVRAVTLDEIDVLVPASVAMFTEEVGVSPLLSDGGGLYRTRIGELIVARRALARIEDGRVVFKAEIGAITPQVCQVQGVWVTPERRGEGLSAPGMAAVVALARAWFAPTVSLYVNHYNAAARKAYDRVGFRQVDTFATVLF